MYSHNESNSYINEDKIIHFNSFNILYPATTTIALIDVVKTYLNEIFFIELDDSEIFIDEYWDVVVVKFDRTEFTEEFIDYIFESSIFRYEEDYDFEVRTIDISLEYILVQK